jgi:hypothetical protein
MTDKSLSQMNHDEILIMKGEMKLIKTEISSIKDNHLKHLDYKITQIQRVMWVIFAGVLANIIHALNILG